MRSLLEWLLLAVGVGAELICCAGLLLARDTFDRLHYVAAANLAGPPPIAAAVIIEEGFNQAGVNALLVAVLLFLLSPLLTVETARAARVVDFGDVEAEDS
jgi:multisubunit Na+/H+ antiporter MnhG subunit